MASIESAIRDFDWRKYLLEHGSVPCGNNEVRINCPECHGESKKLYFNTNKVAFTCFKCDFSGSIRNPKTIVRFVASLSEIPEQSALDLIFDSVGVVPKDWDSLLTQYPEVSHAPPAHRVTPISLPPGTDVLSQEGRTYLLGRGVTETELPLFSSLAYGDSEMVLVKVYAGEIGNPSLVSWQGRFIGPSKIKYLSAPGTKIHDFVWPFAPTRGDALLVEGVYDALAARRMGLHAYCTFGKKLSSRQVDLLLQLGATSVTFGWDIRDALGDILSYADMANNYLPVSILDFSFVKDRNKDLGDALKYEEVASWYKAAYTGRVSKDSFGWYAVCR